MPDEPTKEKMEGDKLMRSLADALAELHDQTDSDCPSEYRTRHLREAMSKARGLCNEFDLLMGEEPRYEVSEEEE